MHIRLARSDDICVSACSRRWNVEDSVIDSGKTKIMDNSVLRHTPHTEQAFW
jgi:hypothetical protein